MNARANTRGPWEDAPLVDQVAELAGEAAWTSMLADFGGKRLFIPLRAGAAHPISVSVGHELAGKLCAAFGGSHVEIPLAPSRRMRIVELLKAGKPAMEVARLVGCTRRHVQAVKAEHLRSADRQPGLFD